MGGLELIHRISAGLSGAYNTVPGDNQPIC
jgi:hypothetical protein